MLAFQIPPPKRPLNDDQDAVRMLLAHALHIYSGRRGQSEFASLVTEISGRQVLQSQVSHWIAGAHAVPGWLRDLMPTLLTHIITVCKARTAAAEEVAKRVGILHLARTGPLDDGPPDDGGPLCGPGDYRPDDDDPAP